jgi:hypothetical protein
VQGEGGLEPAVARGGDDRRVAGLDRVQRGEPPGAAGEHHPGQVVVGEDQRLLERAGGGDVAGGAHLVQRVVLPDRHEPVEEAERGRTREDLHARGARTLGERARTLVPALVEQRSPGLGVLVAEHDVGAQLGGAQRGCQAGDAAADHEHVAVAAAVLRAPGAFGLALGQHAQAGGRAQRLLVQRPQPPRADERLVVEARRGERAADDVGRAHHVEVEPRPGIRVLDRHPVEHGLGARAHAGTPADLDERVGALATTAQLAARPVVLEGAAERAPAGGVQRRRDRVARKCRDRLAVEREADRPVAVDPLPGLHGQARHVTNPSPPALAASGVCGSAFPGASAGSAVHWTSFVVVSRSARNHARQPARWNHHSRWIPATLRRK